jgi:hypothetical protein
MDFEIWGPYAVGLSMSLGGVCVFIWAVLAGAFSNSDEASLSFYRMEMENDRLHNSIAN